MQGLVRAPKTVPSYTIPTVHKIKSNNRKIYTYTVMHITITTVKFNTIMQLPPAASDSKVTTYGAI